MIRSAVFRLACCARVLPRRSFHQASAVFTDVDAQGCENERDVSVYIGDPGDAYVLIPPHDGYAFDAASDIKQELTSYFTRPLVFNHVTQSFTGPSTMLPKLTIPTGLPPQSDLPTSPATLYLFGVDFKITLDGTPDDAFTKLTRESWLRLKPVLDKLKDS